VDYSSGQTIPTNQAVILSGSATKAPVQDYNWNVRRSTLPRYAGSKLTGAKINVHTNGDISYGKEPVINNYQTSFLTFKEIRNAYPELVGKSTLWINSLVDKDGNQLAVDFNTGSNYYYNLISNFGKDSNVNLQITTLPSGSNQTDLDQSTTVYRPALLWPSVILTNELDSEQNPLGQGTFTKADVSINKSNETAVIISKKLFTTSNVSGFEKIIFANEDLADLWYFTTQPGNSAAQDNTINTYGGYGGYGTPINFSLLPNQEIRFDQNENETYIFTDILYVGTYPSGYLQITLNKSLTSTLRTRMLIPSNINDYPGVLVREYQVDPSKLVINAPKLVGGAPGYLTPQYMSPELIASLDKTVETLKENGIL
jgi:hypothetical protein